MKDLCHKWKVKLIFRDAWNSLMAWPDWPRPPLFYDRSTPLRIYYLRYMLYQLHTVIDMCLSVCLLTGLLQNYWSNMYVIKFYRMVGYKPQTNRLDFEWPRPKVKDTRDQKVKFVSLRITSRGESPPNWNLAYSILQMTGCFSSSSSECRCRNSSFSCDFC